MATACIVRHDGLVLAHAKENEHAIELEGNWYFHPDSVNAAVLTTTERTYLCPYKGTCYWIDLRYDGHFVPDVAWVYPEPKPGFRKIAGWYGFYSAAKGYAKQECN